jgi:predicted N-acetyltransferase YhbS
LEESELLGLSEIDRTEVIRVGFEVIDGQLVGRDVDWDAPNFTSHGEGEHSVAKQVEFCRGHLATKALAIGAFAEGTLVGIGVLTPNIRPGMAQLAYLQVSASWRRNGIGTAITRQLLEHARAEGARRVYVSATPSQSAVGFYRSFGFSLVEEPLPELHELEPEDIHMVLDMDVSLGIGSA